MDNALYALDKKQCIDNNDSYFSNISIKIDYLNKILNIFGFKSLLDNETIVKSDNELEKKMINSGFLIKSSYSILMKTFNKRERAKEFDGKFETKKFIKICNCVLNEFGFTIFGKEMERTQKKYVRKRNYIYSIIESMENITEIINKY